MENKISVMESMESKGRLTDFRKSRDGREVRKMYGEERRNRYGWPGVSDQAIAKWRFVEPEVWFAGKDPIGVCPLGDKARKLKRLLENVVTGVQRAAKTAEELAQENPGRQSSANACYAMPTGTKCMIP